MSSFLKFVHRILSGNLFFYVAVGIFVASALWIAFSAAYPLPFDEYYHFGITKLYSDQWTPFISSQTFDTAIYGELTRLSSYLYHYLLSFPLRLVELFTPNEAAQIISLRLINIGLVVGALFVFRKVLLNAKLSHALVHLVLFMFAVTPILALLAAQLNYDNLLLLLVPLNILLIQKIIKSKQFNAKDFILLVILGMVTCLVKFTFLPIIALAFLFMCIVLIKRSRWAVFKQFASSFGSYKALTKVALIAIFALAFGLFVERYGVNYLQYKNFTPYCDQIHSIDFCKNYSPWLRNYNFEQQKVTDPPLTSAPSFTQEWTEKIMEGFFIPFAHIVDGPHTQADPFGPIETRPILRIQHLFAWLILVLGTILAAAYHRRLWRQKELRLLIVISVGYIAVLWIKNFSSFLNFGELAAVQARYLLPILPFIFAIFAQSFAYMLKSSKSKLIAAIVGIVIYIHGAGAAPFIIRSTPSWYWKNETVYSVNQTAKKVLKAITVQ